MSLLNQFILQHVQTSVLNAELLRMSKSDGPQEAKVELNLSPRPVEADGGEGLPAYQVSARLECRSLDASQADGPAFKALVGVEAIYQQIGGEPMDVAQFTGNHAELARQLYPMLQQEMRGLLTRMGLVQIQLPFDLAPRMDDSGQETVEVSSSVH